MNFILFATVILLLLGMAVSVDRINKLEKRIEILESDLNATILENKE